MQYKFECYGLFTDFLTLFYQMQPFDMKILNSIYDDLWTTEKKL